MFDRIELRVFTDKRAACGDEVLPDAVYYALTFGDGFYFRIVGTIEDILLSCLYSVPAFTIRAAICLLYRVPVIRGRPV